MRFSRADTFVAAFAVLIVVASNGCSSPQRSATEPADRLPEDSRSEGASRERGSDAAAPGAAAPRPDASRDLSALLLLPQDVAPFHLIGRADMRDPAGPRFGWPGTELRARFSGTGISLDLADTGVSHYAVSIDGAAPVESIVSGERRTYEIARGLPAGEHDLVVTKRTETFTGVTQLFRIEPQAGGALVPTPAPSGRRMEIVGDSITCGFGVLGSDETCAFTPATESEPLAWGALAARQLSAMHVATAVSGIGLYRNYAGETEGTMPEVYGRSVANDPSSTWDHSFVPDVIVVSLGTNDFAGGKGDPGAVFRDTYVAFLAKLRATHPRAHIVAATSPMLSGANHTMHRAHLDGAIALRRAAGESKLTLLDVEEQDFSDGLGCGYHPSTTTQQKMAARLVAHVRSLTGW